MPQGSENVMMTSFKEYDTLFKEFQDTLYVSNTKMDWSQHETEERRNHNSHGKLYSTLSDALMTCYTCDRTHWSVLSERHNRIFLSQVLLYLKFSYTINHMQIFTVIYSFIFMHVKSKTENTNLTKYHTFLYHSYNTLISIYCTGTLNITFTDNQSQHHFP